MGRRLNFPSLMVRCAALALGLVAYHFVLSELMLHHGLRLGAVSYKLAPLYAYWRPHLKPWLLVPALVLAGYLVWLRRTRVGTSMTEWGAKAAFSGWLIIIATSVAMLDGGTRCLIGPLQRTDLEYYGAVERVQDVGRFLRDYPRLTSTMPMHAQVHPPGAVLFCWAADKVFHAGPWGVAAGIILFSSLSPILVYCWASRIGGPGVARRATAVYVLTPSVVLFTATSMDGPFSVFLIAAMWLVWEGLQSPIHLPRPAAENLEPGADRPVMLSFFSPRPMVLGTLAGLAAAVAALMTYSVVVAVLFCALAVCTWLWKEPGRRVSTLLVAVAACGGFSGLHLSLWMATGYDPVNMFRVAVANHHQIMAGTGHESWGRQFHLAVANLVVFFIAAGLPCTVIWFPAVFEGLRKATGKFAAVTVLTLLIAACVPVYTLEVERVWMFLMPLVVIPVAWKLSEQESRTGHVTTTFAVAVMLALQTLLTEVLLTTYW